MSCEKYEIQILLRDEGELSAEEAGELAKHLESCAACASFAAAASRAREGLEALAPPDPGEAFFAANRARIFAEHQRAAEARQAAGLGARLHAVWRAFVEWLAFERRAVGASAFAAVAAVLVAFVLWPQSGPRLSVGGEDRLATVTTPNGDDLSDADLQTEIGNLSTEELTKFSSKIAIDGAEPGNTTMEEESEGIEGQIDSLSPEEMKRFNQQLVVAVRDAKGA